MPDKKDGGGILGGLLTLVEKLVDLEKRGERVHRSGELRSREGELRGSYDIEVQIGQGAPGGDASSRAPARGAKAWQGSVQPIREPEVDVFEEGEELLVVAQLPGVQAEAVELDLEGDILTIEAAQGDLRYHKEVLLPRSFDSARSSLRNGVLEIALSRKQGKGG